MKTKYRHIHFAEAVTTDVRWGCYTNSAPNSRLGTICWCECWRQFCFYPEPGTVFSTNCLKNIRHFLGQMKEGEDE